MISKIKNINSKIKSSSRGFILPFAVLLSGVILSIGLSVFNIIIKQVIIASSGKESQFAFYSADSGAECAFYWDTKIGIFPTSTDSTTYVGTATCDGTTILPITINSINSIAATTTFTIDSSSYCTRVTVAKFNDRTKIESEGFNTCDITDPRRVERAIRVVY